MFVTDNIGPLNCRGRAVTFVATKVTKKAVSRKAFAARAFALQNGQNLGWIYFALKLTPPNRKNFLCPATAHATIVLAVFARSCSADGKGTRELCFFYLTPK
ncbi:hypothetical protein ACFGVS_14360 [Mucilaginibacter sp. AW1-7]|uniref:hypothetical protein n=1 Tax=Mucilaginibacter sp. AW1-7 TaxID=3349874 RepID=UPI003F73EC28